MNHQTIIVLDFGGQYNQLIARRVRECGVYCEVKPYTTPLADLLAMKPIGFIFTGGPNSVYLEDAPHVDPALFDAGVPVLGICYGCQLIAHHLGGKVVAASDASAREYGKTETFFDTSCKLFKGLPEKSVTWMSHGDYMEKVPDGFSLVAHSDACPNVAICDEKRGFYGVQYHPEVNHTEYGKDMIRNFLYEVCGAKGDWTMGDYKNTAIAAVREKVGSGRVLLALSGSEMVKAAHAIGLPVASEVFADRGYKPDGTLVPRGTPGAMITDEDTAMARVLQMAKQGTVQADDGSTVALQADSVCVHGDGPKALAFVQKISAALPAAGVEIKAF